MKKLTLALLILTNFCLIAQARESNYTVDEKYMVNGEYRGRFCAPAEYVLSGQYAKDIGQLPQVPWHYNTAKEGYKQDAISPVPAPGVHPRVLMNIEDIENIRKVIAQGENAPRYFKIILNWAKNRKDLHTRSFMALIADDKEQAKKCVDEYIELLKVKEPMIDILNTDPQTAGIRDNYFYYARTAIVKVGGVPYMEAYRQGGAQRIHELAKKSVVYDWEFPSQKLSDTSGTANAGAFFAYDYLHKYMTDQQRQRARRVIKKITFGRYTSGMNMPGNMFINNHMSMSYDNVLAALCIEGQEGFDQRVITQAAKSLNNQLTYYISNGGYLYEKNKGFVPERAILAITKRKDYPLLSHSHLYNMVMAKAMDSANVFWRYNEIRNHQKIADLGKGFEEPRNWYMGWASGPWMDFFFNAAFSMKFVYPEDPIVDFYYKSRLQTQGFGPPDAQGPVPTPRIRYTFPEICLLTTCQGLKDSQGNVINYDKTGPPKALTDNTAPWVDYQRGVAQARSSWDKDALMVHYECRSDIYAAGHETPEAGDFGLFANGIEWSGWRKWYLDSYFRNAVLIDGKAGIYAPTAGKLMEVNDTSHGVTIISDATDQYNWRKFEKNMFLWAGSNTDALKGWHFDGGTSKHWARDWEVPFQEHMREYLEGFACMDWGNWHGETRGMEMYGRWNDVDHVFRTLHLAKGKHPYVLVVDDVRKDDKIHQYDWVMKLSNDIVLWKANSGVGSRAFGFNYADHQTDIYLCSADAPERRRNHGGVLRERLVKRGDPVLLVRVLHRNSTFEFPQPAYEENYTHPRIKIPALAVDPEFRVMLYPHRHGDPIPITKWNDDRSELSVIFADQLDKYNFAQTDRQRTTITAARDDSSAQIAPALPTTPKFISSAGFQPDKNIDNQIREITFHDKTTAKLNNPPLTQAYRYTLNGTEPTANSDLYTKPVTISKSLTFKAKAFADDWPFADSNASKTLTVKFTRDKLQKPVKVSTSAADGLKCEVFEIHHTMFEKHNGIFTGQKNMLPELDRHTPMQTLLADGAVVPEVKQRKLPKTEMAKGYYRYTGFFYAGLTGDYSFKLNSCGPVQLKIGDKTLIKVLLPYGLSQKDRFGQVSLKEGWHPFEMTVTDPIFWKAADAEQYQISLGVIMPGSSEYVTVKSPLFATTEKGLKKTRAKSIPASKGKKLKNLKQGLVAKWSLPDATAPAITEILPSLKDDPIDGKVVQYTGFISVREPGIYTFITDGGGLNELKIGKKTICQVTPDLAENTGSVNLNAGCHPLQFTVNAGTSNIKTIAPNRTAPVDVPESFFYYNPSKVTIPTGLDYGLSIHLPFDELKDSATPVAIGAPAKANVYSGKIVDDPQRGKVFQPSKRQYSSYMKDYDLNLENIPRTRYERTLSIWFKPQSKGSYIIFRTKHNYHVHYNVVIYNKGFLGMSGGVGANPRISSDVKPEQWNHLALVYKDGKTLWYLNGKYFGMMLDRNFPENNLFAFCGDDDILYDDLKIYDRPLSAKEVKELSGK